MLGKYRDTDKYNHLHTVRLLEHFSCENLQESTYTLSINSLFPDVLWQSKYDLKTWEKALIWLSKVGQGKERNHPDENHRASIEA